MPPPPRIDNNSTTIILEMYLIVKMIPKFEKKFPLVCRVSQDESIDI